MTVPTRPRTGRVGSPGRLRLPVRGTSAGSLRPPTPGWIGRPGCARGGRRPSVAGGRPARTVRPSRSSRAPRPGESRRIAPPRSPRTVGAPAPRTRSASSAWPLGPGRTVAWGRASSCDSSFAPVLAGSCSASSAIEQRCSQSRPLRILGASRGPSTPHQRSRPWSCGRAGAPSKVRVSAARPSPGRHVHGRGAGGARGGEGFGSGAAGDGAACPWVALRMAGSSGLPGHMAKNSASNANRCGSSAQQVGPGGRPPSPRVGIAPQPDGPPGRDDGGLVRRGALPASQRLCPLGPVFSNPLRSRGARSANGLT